MVPRFSSLLDGVRLSSRNSVPPSLGPGDPAPSDLRTILRAFLSHSFVRTFITHLSTKGTELHGERAAYEQFTFLVVFLFVRDRIKDQRVFISCGKPVIRMRLEAD
jgi:hypothetical protein